MPQRRARCTPGPHIRPCGPTGDAMYCACGCSGADESCWLQDEAEESPTEVQASRDEIGHNDSMPATPTVPRQPRVFDTRVVSPEVQAQIDSLIRQRADQPCGRDLPLNTWWTLDDDHHTAINWLCTVVGSGTNSRFLNSVHSQLHEYGRLTDRQFEAIRTQNEHTYEVAETSDEVRRAMADDLANEMSAELHRNEAHRIVMGVDPAFATGGVIGLPDPNEPATRDQATQIPNGAFSVDFMDDDGESFDFDYQIYTVTRGPLEGKRIIKFQSDRIHAFASMSGFAFLTVGGGLKIWRRFSQYEDSAFVRGARRMLDDLRAAAGGPLSDHVISRTVRACRYCNRATMTGSSEGLCLRCQPAPEVVAPAHRPRVVARPDLVSRPRTRTTVVNSRANTPIMSELGTGWER